MDLLSYGNAEKNGNDFFEVLNNSFNLFSCFCFERSQTTCTYEFLTIFQFLHFSSIGAERLQLCSHYVGPDLLAQVRIDESPYVYTMLQVKIFAFSINAGNSLP